VPAREEPKPLTEPAAIFAALEAGNARFVASKRVQSADTKRDGDERSKFAKTQKPFVALLTCADSRIVPEFVFDQQLGSIFEVRNAGNVVEDVGLGTMEYGTEHIHIPVLVVMGHTGCGAIKAANEADGQPLPNHVKDVQARLSGLKGSFKPKDTSDAFLTGLSEKNARQQADQLLAQSEALRGAVKDKHLVVAAALYDIATGEVKFLDKNVQPK
jgi:carbonic anhydrase